MDLGRFGDKKIALLGFGIENISVAKFFLKQGIDFVILDREDDKLGNPEGQNLIDKHQLTIITGPKYLSNLSDYNMVIRSPGVPYLTLEIQNAKSSGVEITSSTKLFFDLAPVKIIGVTGTKGKGTTASLISEILKMNVKAQSSNVKIYLAGNIGVPSFDIIENLKSDDLVVFELSSFQLQDMELSPHIAVVVNLADDHLDYHQTLEEYRATKQNILKYQSASDFAVINQDYPESRKLAEFGKAKKFFFSSKEKIVGGAYVDESGDVFLNIDGEEKICSQNELKLIGRHNLENIASAAIVSKILQVPAGIIHDAVKDFNGLPHRLEFIREVDGIKFYNDSFSTNPTPTIAAIRSFSSPVTIIMGGSSKGADFTELAEEIKSSTVKNAVVIGVEGPKIRTALESSGAKINIINGGKSIEEIMTTALKNTSAGGVILFSPACASFDMFKNYKDRGEKFINTVERL